MKLFKDQFDHYGKNWNLFTLDEKINDRYKQSIHMLKMIVEHEDLDKETLNKLSRKEKAEIDYFIKMVA